LGCDQFYHYAACLVVGALGVALVILLIRLIVGY
jgi:hypothetical protein